MPTLSCIVSEARDASRWSGWLAILEGQGRDQGWFGGKFGNLVLCAETVGFN